MTWGFRNISVDFVLPMLSQEGSIFMYLEQEDMVSKSKINFLNHIQNFSFKVIAVRLQILPSGKSSKVGERDAQ